MGRTDSRFYSRPERRAASRRPSVTSSQGETFHAVVAVFNAAEEMNWRTRDLSATIFDHFMFSSLCCLIEMKDWAGVPSRDPLHSITREQKTVFKPNGSDRHSEKRRRSAPRHRGQKSDCGNSPPALQAPSPRPRRNRNAATHPTRQ